MGGVALAWRASTDTGSGIKSYYLYRNGTVIASTGNLSFTDTTGVDGTSYTYSVTAVDQVGNESGQSNTMTVTYVAPSKGGGNKRRR